MWALGLLFVAAGAFSMLGAICDWESFINARKARSVVKLFGRSGERVFYGLSSLAIPVVGVLGLTGVVDLSIR